MSEPLKNRMKDLTKEIFTQWEQQIAYVKKGLKDLLEEEDLKMLPSYDLLHSVYSLYLTDAPIAPTSAPVTAFDPLYAPSKRTPRAASTTTTDSALDLNSSLLDAPAPTKTVVKIKTAAKTQPQTLPQPQPKAQTEVVVVDAGEDTIYKVEIQGKVYLRYAANLYDIDTKMQVGSITNDGFVIGGVTTPIVGTPRLERINDQYWKNDERTLYVKVHSDADIYQAVGEAGDGDDIGLW